jgi:hypothetical protein
LCTSRYRIVGGINIEVKRFSVSNAIFFTTTPEAALDFIGWDAMCVEMRKRVRWTTNRFVLRLRIATTLKALEYAYGNQA